MNGFWKKKVPSFLLALVMVAGMMPAVMAEPLEGHEHGFEGTPYKMDAEGHWQECSDCGAASSKQPHDKTQADIKADATCYQPGTTEYTCGVCGFTWRENDIPATGSHTFAGGSWQSDDTGHQQHCVTPGCPSLSERESHSPRDNGKPVSPTCTADGYTEYVCIKCGRTYRFGVIPKLGHTPGSDGKCTRCGALTHSHDYETVWTSDSGYHWHRCRYCTDVSSRSAHADANRDGRCDVCNYGMATAANLTVTFMNGGSVFGTPQSLTAGSRPSNPGTPVKTGSGCTYTFTGWTTTPTTTGVYNNASLNPRYTSAQVAAMAVNQNTTYYAVYTLAATGQNDSLGVGTTGGKIIGGDIRTKIAAKFNVLTGVNSFQSVRFSTSGSGTLYSTSGKAALSTGNYPFSDLPNYLYFIPAASGSMTLSYTAADNFGNQISGSITLSGSPVATADITYKVAPGGTVNFKVSHFEDAYSKLSGGSSTLRYVTFSPSSSYDNFAGMLYTGSRSLDRDRLSRWSFYLSSDRYGDYALDTLNFKAETSAKQNAELSIPFRAYNNNGVYYDGTVRIVIDKDGQEGDVIYRVAPGGSVTFNRSDFNSAYQDVANSSRTIRYVEFDPDSSYTNFSGKISASGHSDFTRNELSREQFNYSGTSYGDYALDDLIFRASSGAREGDTLEIPFQAYYNRDDSAKCTLRIIIDKNGSADTVTCNVAPGGTARLNRSDFNDVYRALSGYKNRTISAVSFNAPESYKNFAGSLYVKNRDLTLSDLTYSRTLFYYDDSRDGDFALEDLTFQAERNAKEGASLSIPFRAYYDGSSDYEEGVLRINITSSVNTITYEAAPGGSVELKADDFNKAYQTMSGTSRTIRYVAFDAGSDYASFAGRLYAGSTQLNRSSLTYTQTQFYYSSSSYGAYALSSLTFRPDSAAKDKAELSIPFRAYYSDSDYEQGTLKLVVSTSAGGDITYTVTPGKTVNLDRVKFDEFFRKTYSSYNLDYVVFDVPSATDFPDAYGTLYTGYNTSYSNSFSRSSLRDVRFYYNANDAGRGDYALNDLTFAAASSFTSGKVTLRFTAYGTNSRTVEGKLVLAPTAPASATSNYVGSVRYAVTTGTNVQINANDLARFYKGTYPSGTLQYVTLSDVPAAGTLYYNYYSASRYGTSAREQITAANRSRSFYLSPASPGEYALTELTYVPSGSNYCASIPFTAYGTGGQSVTGSILISVTNKAVSEVYGPTPRNTAVTFPASSIYAAVSAATGTAPSGFQLLKLPAASVGAIYVGAGTATPANTTTVYGYNTGSQQLGQLRFVPTSTHTGPVEIPYVALNANGVAIASGMFSMGVLNTNKRFGDITASTWCYKYVTELADASVIDGYSDGNFKPDNTITYGAALKLIMLAAGYSEQAPTVKGSTFSGYLSKAQADGLITRSNVNLSGSITRLQVAQLAAGALKLDINNLSSVKPFTDTADVYVQALNAAGIVEGYFSNGTSTFRPSNTLTRGQVSAIVWRMQNYRR